MYVLKDLPLRCTLLLILNEFRHLLNGILRRDCIVMVAGFTSCWTSSLWKQPCSRAIYSALCVAASCLHLVVLCFSVCARKGLFFSPVMRSGHNSVVFLLLQRLWLTGNLAVTHSLPITQSFGLNGSTFVWCEPSPILVCRKQRPLPYTTRPWIYRNMTGLRSLPRPTMSSWRRACCGR